ncbi:MAG: hypothetical protein A3E38_00025 [Candidatus Moranbacteria bacterium RIFCSPHIGHO2_12_FULL_54_9]|nr:MAG: hypothetical protein A3E38_00025 [Candidatus Moranbacteria bacterium RIFCSPHIGHO2_12_FULL_54_9]
MKRGFTLIETLVAVSLLSIAIVAPMTLTAKSLASAYYSRDQITAFYLAQEAIEALRSVRDGQVLQIAQSGSGADINLFGPIPIGTTLSPKPFTIDARKADPSAAITTCPDFRVENCPALQTDGTLYGYDPGWTTTNFKRTVTARFTKNADGSDNEDEVRVTVTVTWQTGIIKLRTFSISEDLYRWVNDGSGRSQL